jgi:hypothetical protein
VDLHLQLLVVSLWGMAKIKDAIYEHDGVVHMRQWHYMCPGCGYIHALSPDVHQFNGDYEKPTFSPSCLQNWDPTRICHSFIRDGRIQFLSDCSHSLAGQTVDLPEIE